MTTTKTLPSNPYSQSLCQTVIGNCPEFHSYSRKAAELWFEKIEEGVTRIDPAPCPICQGRVTEIWPNPDLQKTVDASKTIGINTIDPKQTLSTKSSIKYPLAPSFFDLKQEEMSAQVQLLNFEYDPKKGSNLIRSLHFGVIQKEYKVGVVFNDESAAAVFFDYFDQKNVKFSHSKIPLRNPWSMIDKDYDNLHLWTKDLHRFLAIINEIGKNNEFSPMTLAKIAAFVRILKDQRNMESKL